MPQGKGYTITIDGVASTALTGFMCHEIERQLIADRRTEYDYVGGMAGALVFGEEPGLRLITAQCSVLIDAVSAPARRAAVREVAAWYNHHEMKKVIFGDEPTMMEWAIPRAAPNVREWRQRGQFDLEWLCGPYSYDVDVSVATDVTASPDHVIQVTNDGDVATPFVLEFEAASAASTQAVQVNDRTWTHGANLATGEFVTFNTLTGTINLGENYDTDLRGIFLNGTLSMIDSEGRPPMLEPGVNDVHVLAPSTGATVRVLHRNRYS